MRVRRFVVALIAILAVMSAGLGTAALAAAGETLVINEIHYNPGLGDDGDAEFIELHNPGTTALDVTGYTVDDENSAGAGTTLVLSGSVPAGGYVILTPTGFDAFAR